VSSSFTAIYDACVLYSYPLRHLLMELALTDLYRARWSDEIHEEWMRNVRANNPAVAEDKLLRTRDLMNAHVRDSLVTGYEGLIPGFNGTEIRYIRLTAWLSGDRVVVSSEETAWVGV
jgi:hypothetical protein